MLKTAVIVFPGTNCDQETFFALQKFNLNPIYIWHEDIYINLKQFNAIFLPGGFSYGDYIKAGRIAKLSHIVQNIKQYSQNLSGIVVGICNGFQILCEAKLLPGALIENIGQKFISKNTQIIFDNKTLTLPIAHKEGRFFCNKQTYCQLIQNKNCSILKYKDNPNGSSFDIAGIYDKKHKVFGLMPHPERAIFENLPLQDGKIFFNFIYQEILKLC